jgi:hypothetical protein
MLLFVAEESTGAVIVLPSSSPDEDCFTGCEGRDWAGLFSLTVSIQMSKPAMSSNRQMNATRACGGSGGQYQAASRCVAR